MLNHRISWNSQRHAPTALIEGKEPPPTHRYPRNMSLGGGGSQSQFGRFKEEEEELQCTCRERAPYSSAVHFAATPLYRQTSRLVTKEENLAQNLRPRSVPVVNILLVLTTDVCRGYNSCCRSHRDKVKESLNKCAHSHRCTCQNCPL